MDVLTFRPLFEQSRASKFSRRGERIHTFMGTLMEASWGVWWIGGTALVNGDGFSPSAKGRYYRRRAIHIS